MGGFQGTGRANIKMLSGNTVGGINSLGLISEITHVESNSFRVQVIGADPANEVTVWASLDNVNWKLIGRITGDGICLLDTQAYDFLKLETEVYGGTPFSVNWKSEEFPAAFGIVGKDGQQASVTSGKLDVRAEIVNPGAESNDVTKNFFGEALAVPASVQTTILSHTVPVTKGFEIMRVSFGGCNIASYELYLDNVKSAKKRTYFSGDLFGEFEFSSEMQNGHFVPGGTVIQVRVTHERPEVGDFEARIFGIEKEGI